MKNVIKFLLMMFVCCFIEYLEGVGINIMNNTPTQMVITYERRQGKIFPKRGIQYRDGKFIVLPYSEGRLVHMNFYETGELSWWDAGAVKLVYWKKEGGEIQMNAGKWDLHNMSDAYIIVELRNCKNGKDRDKHGNYCYKVKPDVSREDYYRDLAGNTKIQETLKRLEEEAAAKKAVEEAKKRCEGILKDKLDQAGIEKLEADIAQTQAKIANWEKKQEEYGLSGEEKKTYQEQQDLLKQQQNRLDRAVKGAENYKVQGCQEKLGKPYG